MLAYEFIATVHDGVLPVAPELEGRVVRAIVLCEVESASMGVPAPSWVDALWERRSHTDVPIQPLTRDEVHNRA